MKTLLLGAAVALLALARAQADTVIDFTEFASEFGTLSGPFDSKGFHFDSSAAHSGASPFFFYGLDYPWSADPAGTTLSQELAGTTTTLTRLGDGAFDLDAADFGDVYNRAGNPEDVTLVGTRADGTTISTVVTTNGLAGLTHFPFGDLFQDMVQLAWTPGNGAQNDFLQSDNVSVRALAALPEPPPVLVLAGGLVGLGVVLLRRPAT